MKKRRLTSRPSPIVLLLVCLLLLPSDFAGSQSGDAAKPTTVYLVRHTEKQEPAWNPDTGTPLTAEGRARAEKLAELLSGCSVAAVFTSTYMRTQLTAKPFIERNHLTGAPTILDPRAMASLLDQIRKSSGNSVLVVGHSNTVPAAARALVGRDDAVPDIPDSAYHDLFVVTITQWEPRQATVRHFRFGKNPSGEAAALPEFTGCPK